MAEKGQQNDEHGRSLSMNAMEGAKELMNKLASETADAGGDPNSEEAKRATRDMMWDAFDYDGSGSITKPEFDKLYPVIVNHVQEQARTASAIEANLARKKQQVKMLGVVSGVMVCMIFILLFGNLGLTYMLQLATQETTVGGASNGTGTDMTDMSGGILGTREAQVYAPMVYSPLLALETLANVKQVYVTVDGIPAYYTITGFERSSKMQMVFYTSVNNDIIRITNGQIRVNHANGKTSLACSKKALCSAIKVSDMNATYLEALSTEFDAELEAMDGVAVTEPVPTVPNTDPNTTNPADVNNVDGRRRKLLEFYEGLPPQIQKVVSADQFASKAKLELVKKTGFELDDGYKQGGDAHGRALGRRGRCGSTSIRRSLFDADEKPFAPNTPAFHRGGMERYYNWTKLRDAKPDLSTRYDAHETGRQLKEGRELTHKLVIPVETGSDLEWYYWYLFNGDVPSRYTNNANIPSSAYNSPDGALDFSGQVIDSWTAGAYDYWTQMSFCCKPPWVCALDSAESYGGNLYVMTVPAFVFWIGLFPLGGCEPICTDYIGVCDPNIYA